MKKGVSLVVYTYTPQTLIATTTTTVGRVDTCCALPQHINPQKDKEMANVLPPFTAATAHTKVKAAQALWNTRSRPSPFAHSPHS